MDQSLSALVSEAKPAPFWSDQPGAPEEAPALRGTVASDLAIIGSGFTGLWAAILAAEANPGRSIVVVEAETTGFGASSRNGGFCDPSLTHGLANGFAKWPDELPQLLRLGEQNFAALTETIARHNIGCDFRVTDEVEIALQPWQLEDLAEVADLNTRFGQPTRMVDQAGARAIADSPTYLGGLVREDAIALVDPARLAWGLRHAAESLGVQFFDRTRVLRVDEDNPTLRVVCSSGTVSADRVLVATNAWAQPELGIRRHVVPVYDHVLMTEPLSDEQLAAIGWTGREGLADAGWQFHYYRLTADNRILWGGWDANYYKGDGMGAEYEDRRASFELLAAQFFATFPQLVGLGFSHRWAGPIGTTSRFTAAWGQRFGGRLVWAAGYTGLGVGASRFGAAVALDLVDGVQTERTALRMVRQRPFPFPPNPLRNPVIQFTRRQIARADANGGRPGPWLSLLDRFGVGFDS